MGNVGTPGEQTRKKGWKVGTSVGGRVALPYIVKYVAKQMFIVRQVGGCKAAGSLAQSSIYPMKEGSKGLASVKRSLLPADRRQCVACREFEYCVMANKGNACTGSRSQPASSKPRSTEQIWPSKDGRGFYECSDQSVRKSH